MILIVDDKPENLLSLRKILEVNNFEVDTASSGEEALKKILKNTYFLIILDVQMPGMDGFEVAETISGYSKAKDIPIIFLSAVNTDKRFILKGYASGALDYVTKPVDPDILLLKVKTFYRLYEQARELNRIQSALLEEIEVRKQAQNELRDRNRELRSILESIPQIAFTAKQNGEVEFVNKHWFEYSSDSKKFPEVQGNTDIESEWKKAVEKKEPLEMEVRVRKRGSEEGQWHLLRAIPVKDESDVVKWVGTFTNIEDQKQALQKKNEFISIASHELKTPLTSIKAYIHLLHKSMKNNANSEASQFLQRTQVQIDKLYTLIADLLDISKIESGKLKFNKKLFVFENLLSNTIEITRQTYPGYNIVRKGSADVKVFGDEIRIEQVLINYFSNAVKYSPDCREVHITTEVTDNNHLKVCVKDFGIGISEDKQKNIFNKFYRVEDNSTRFQGLGIGLYICSEIIKRHDGEIGVNSKPGEGSEFYFTLPISAT